MPVIDVTRRKYNAQWVAIAQTRSYQSVLPLLPELRFPVGHAGLVQSKSRVEVFDVGSIRNLDCLPLPAHRLLEISCLGLGGGVRREHEGVIPTRDFTSARRVLNRGFCVEKCAVIGGRLEESQTFIGFR